MKNEFWGGNLGGSRGRGGSSLTRLGGTPPLPRKIKMFLPTYRKKGHPNTYIQKHIYICQTNKKTDVKKLRFFSKFQKEGIRIIHSIFCKYFFDLE